MRYHGPESVYIEGMRKVSSAKFRRYSTICRTVLHFVKMGVNFDIMHNTPAWPLLTPEASSRTSASTPGHCMKYGDAATATHFLTPVAQGKKGSSCQKYKPISTLWVFLSQLLTSSYSHLVLEPVIGKDIVYDKGAYARRRQPFRLGLDPELQFRCERCPELPIYKPWEMQVLALHLQTEYGFFHGAAILYYPLDMTSTSQSRRLLDQSDHHRCSCCCRSARSRICRQ